MQTVDYFAYGSNMSVARLGARVSGAVAMGQHRLHGFALRFHKHGRDGSGKCDALHTGRSSDLVRGVLFRIPVAAKIALDRCEGLGYGYAESQVGLLDNHGTAVSAVTYVAARIDPQLLPFSWYLQHVLTGALDAGLPREYLRMIEQVRTAPDPDLGRERRELAIYAAAN